MVVIRPFWQNLIEEAWKKRSVIWLMGIRRVGKTSLCRSLSDIVYFDCESAQVRSQFDYYEDLLNSYRGKRLVIDEIHRLDRPSEVLKVAADHYPDIKIIATGSSTLGTNAKFKDTLTGRKTNIWLSPMLLNELELFGDTNLQHRFLAGGLPAFFTDSQIMSNEYALWMDAYWAKDIQDMFSVGKRGSFLKFADLLLAQSGGIFEATKFAIPCEISRITLANYLAVLEETFIVHVIKPYSTHKAAEITKAPRVYAFDTGFACHARGIQTLRPEDMGFLWEHCVLNELNAQLQLAFRRIHYWRDKQGREIDFVIREKGHDNPVTAIECKYRSSSISLNELAPNFTAFRNHYPLGKNYVVASDVQTPIVRQHKNLTITFIGANDLAQACRDNVY